MTHFGGSIVFDENTPRNTAVQRLLTSSCFELCVTILIVSNLIFVGIQAEYVTSNLTTTMPITYRVIEYTYTAVFTVELLLRVYAYRFGFFVGTDWMWHWLDVAIVVFAFVGSHVIVVACLVVNFRVLCT